MVDARESLWLGSKMAGEWENETVTNPFMACDENSNLH